MYKTVLVALNVLFYLLLIHFMGELRFRAIAELESELLTIGLIMNEQKK
jgi:hypothetical protein